jgi:serine/threonine protein kinase
VQGLGFFHENRTSYIVMERLTGADIKTLLNEIPPQEVLPFCEFVVRSVGAALIEVHNRGIIHLDVSPANIFFQSDGSLRLIDFGSATYMNDAGQDTVQLKHGFAPPELYSVSAPKGPWTDVYALAATYYNLVSGVRVSSAQLRLVRDELTPLEKLRPDVHKH